jgi:hypothetical protein
MKREKVQSSSIVSIGYEADTQTLEIEFTSGGIYSYAGVPQDVYEAFMHSDSKGHFFAVDIRACYEHVRLNPKPEKKESERHGEEKGKKKAKAAKETERKTIS